jgi:hypothetical protein
MTTIDQIKRKVGALEEQHEVEEGGDKVLLLIPDNGRAPGTGPGRYGNMILYDKDHPAESFMTIPEHNATHIRSDEPGP